MSRLAWRIRLMATCAVLAAVAFTQSPGLTAADTKLDLTQNPSAFLERALHLWDDLAFFGQLQNQGYGYLFPVGPFFWIGHTLHLEPWIVQRVWWWLLLCTAFLGLVRLGRLVGLTRPSARWTAGIVFALSPRVVSTLGPISVETLPYVLTPWMLVPLASLRADGRVRRAATRSGLAVLLMGGINAVATVVAGALGALWIATETPRSIRLRLGLSWAGAAALATAWFLGPLVLLGRYSPPFLDWIESASVTTSVTDGSASLRGVTDWVAYVGGAGGSQWPAGFAMVNERLVVVGTVVVAAAGTAGLALRRTRHRRFLVASFSIGLVAIVGAHVSAAGPWADGLAAPAVRDLLDAALAPLRNVHKFDVWLRLPLAVGVGWTLTAILDAGARGRVPYANMARRLNPRLVPQVMAWLLVVAMGSGIAAATWPAVRGDLTVGRTFLSVPGYWLDTTAWLASTSGRGRALLVPGASFGTYLWGQSHDEPLQVFATTPWAVRDAVPLSSAGNIRALDLVESMFTDGRGDPHLADYLARMGVAYVVVRNDLNYTAASSPRPSLLHQTLIRSGGFDLEQTFGPLLAGFETDNLKVDAGIDGAYHAVEIYRVASAAADPRVQLRDASRPDVVDGESESLLGLLAMPGESRRSVVRTGDLPADSSTGRSVVTDSGRRLEVDFGRVHDNRSSTLDPGDPWTVARRVHDYGVSPAIPLPVSGPPDGVGVTASSSRGDAASVVLDPASGPWNAVDGVDSTAWFPRPFDRTDPWWQIQRSSPMEIGGAVVRLATTTPVSSGSAVLRITTDTQERDLPVVLPSAPVVLPADLGPTRRLRFTLTSVDAPSGTGVGIAEVTLAGVDGRRSLYLPASGGRDEALSLTVRGGSRLPCVVRYPTVCLPSLGRSGEEARGLDRTVDTSGITGDLHVTAQPRPGRALDDLLQPTGAAPIASASSTWVADPAARAQAAIDGDPWTAWVADTGDRRPTLRIALPHPVRISYLRLIENAGLGASRPLAVSVAVGDEHFTAISDDRGFLRFPPTLTSRIELTVTTSQPVLSYDSALGRSTVLPVGISDLSLGEADSLRQEIDRTRAVSLPCGSGPSITVDGSAGVPTSLSTTIGEVLDGVPATATSCGPASLSPGAHRLLAASVPTFDVTSVVWAATSGVATLAQPTVTSWSANARTIAVPLSPEVRTLELAENANAGWVARLGGVDLEPLRVDGWRQAWLLPAGLSGVVEIDFAPDRPYRSALLAGVAAALLLVVLMLLPSRRRIPQLLERRSAVPAGTRLLLLTVVAVAALGVAGTCAALADFVLVRRRGSAARVAGAGVLVATTIAMAAPWPAGTVWADPWRAVAAVVVSVGTGVVAGSVFAAGLRNGAPSAVRGVRPSDR